MSSATDRKSKPNLDGLNRRELKICVGETVLYQVPLENMWDIILSCLAISEIG